MKIEICKTCGSSFKKKANQRFCNKSCLKKINKDLIFNDIEKLYLKIKRQCFFANFEDILSIIHIHLKVSNDNINLKRGNDFYMMMTDIIDWYKKNKKYDRV